MKNRTLYNRIKKYIIVPAAAFSVFFTTIGSVQTAYGAIIYENSQQEIVTKGVTYEYSRQATDKGLLDVHVLTVDITDPLINVKPVQSVNGYGLKETVSTLLNDSGAVAGVNADYFDMTASPVTSFGPVIVDGDIVSLDEGEEGYAMFFIDEDNNPFIEYAQPDIQFLNNGVSNINVHSYNKFKNNFSAMYFDRRAITDTASFDEKWPDLVKFVIEDDVITYISAGGETVTVPENGYIIVVAATYAQYFYDSVKVGDTAEIKIEARFDYEAINTAIGGAGKILENGAYSNYGYVVSPTSRQPRTALGISQDQTKLIMVVVDGRSHSIGATHEEMASIMLKYGAWNALQLDGGGSSTMAVNALDDTSLNVVNTLSEGSQRKVVNGLGVFNEAPLGEISSIMLNTPSDTVFNGSAVTLAATGLDEYYNKIDIAGVNFTSTDPNGRWEGNVFYPGTLGQITLMAEYNGMTAVKEINNLSLAQLDPNKESLTMSIGQTAALSFSGIGTNGYTGPVSGVNYEVVPAELGTVENNVFTAKGGESGYIKCYIGDIVTYIDVTLGTKLEAINSFNSAVPVEFMASGDTVSGTAYLTDAINTPGNNAVALEYSFAEGTSTQAAYTKFTDNIKIPSGASAIKLSVYGDNSGNWLRGKLVDAEGTEHLVDFTKSVDFTGWQQLTASIPAEAAQPVKLERIYIASLSNTDTARKVLYFDDLMGEFPATNNAVSKPASSKYANPFNVTLEGAAPAGFDITFAGNIAVAAEEKPEGYEGTQAGALGKFKANTAKGYLAGNSDIDTVEGVETVNMGSNYNFGLNGNYAVVQMSASNGSLAKTAAYNWSFVNESKNSEAKHILLVLDKKPSNFSSAKEYALFQDACEEIVAAGKNVFVISTEGYENSTIVRNGVNYVNIASLFKDDKTVNNEFATLRFRINGDDIKFDIQKAF